MALNSAVKHANSLLLGVCIPCLKHNASKFKVQHLKLDKKLLMFFPESTTIYAHDPKKICKTGDVVLIQVLPEKMSSEITHKVVEIIYAFGDIVDPVTGKRVAARQYREDMDLKNETLGKGKNAFNYQKAPKRGWQEGKKDFSHRETYVKYHEFEEGDENRDQPNSTPYA